MKTISVIIPVFNTEKYIEDCLQSISKQSFTDFEILAINDGSTDSSLEILEKYQEKETRLHIFSQENSGVSVARNLGIEKAKGDYIAFIDSDDTIDKFYLERLYKSITSKENIDMSICGFEGTSITKYNECEIQLNEDALQHIINLFSNYLLFTPVCKFYKSEIIKNNNLRFVEKLQYSEDVLFNLAYLKKSTVLKSIDYVGYNYRILQSSLSKKSDIEKFFIVDEMNFNVENYLNDLNKGNNDEKKEEYINDLTYWNAYDAVFKFFEIFDTLKFDERVDWIKNTIKLKFFRENVKVGQKYNDIMKVFRTKNVYLILVYIYFRKKVNRL